MTVLFSCWLLIHWTGGLDELARVTNAAGAFSSLVLLSGLVELSFLTVMICHIGTGRMEPLAVMLGMATLPWTVGLLGSEVEVNRAVAALAELDSSEARSVLAAAVGEAMASRMLGAWMSATLLAGVGLGLAMAGTAGEGPWHSALRGSVASLLFGVVVAFALAAIALVGAMEAHRLFEALSRLAHAPLSERAHLLRDATEGMTDLRPLRNACMALLATLGVVLFAWQLRRRARPARGWMGSAFLVAAVTSLLLLDAHPLSTATHGARAAGLDPLLLPSQFQALEVPRPSRALPLAALATPEGITPAQGARLPWSVSPEALAQALSSSLGPSGTPAIPKELTPEPALPVLADARLSGTALRRLLEASDRAGARSVQLVGRQPRAASMAALEQLRSQDSLFPMLVAQPGTLQLLLPRALAHGALPDWRARLERGDTLSLSRVSGGDVLTLSLHASPAEVPPVLAGTFVGLELSEELSLQELGAAAEVLGMAGASPVVLSEPSSVMARPADGGTDTLWISPAPGPLAPRLIRRLVEVQRHALEAFQQAQEEARRARESPSARPAESAQRSQASSTMAAMTPRPNTTSITTPSYLDDWGSFGAAFRADSTPSAVVADTGAAADSRGRSEEWVTTEASRSSRPSRASASTRFMWSM
jgi:hypothetical protein